MSQGPPIDLERSTNDGDISLGRELRRAREVRGISVSQIAQETKINERYIHALENDRLDLLPGQPYTGNFVRSIARAIGADEEELIDYLNYHLRLQQPERRDDARSSSRQRPRPGLLPVIVVGGILLVVMITMALRGGGETDSKTKPPRESQRIATSPVAAEAQAIPATTDSGLPAAGAAGTAAAATGPKAAAPVLGTLAPVAASAPAATPASGPVPTSALGSATGAVPSAADAPAGTSAVPGASAPAGASAADGPAPRVRLVFREKSWVEIEQDGDAAPMLGIRQVGEELTWTLDRPLRMKINNAGGVDLYIDGQAAKPLGGPRETRTLVIDRRNWKSLVR